jgi:hypothetical protein
MEVWLRENGAPDSFFAPDPAIGDGPNAHRAAMARNIFNAPQIYGPAFNEKDWALLATDREHPFLIGDHPLTKHNMIDRGPRGNLGLKAEGIKLYLPLSPELTLALWCPSHRRAIEDGLQRLEQTRNASFPSKEVTRNARATVVPVLEAIRTGKPMHASTENVEFSNSLQVSTAERFVFSCTDDFTLVEQMLAANPNLRYGPRFDEATGKF